MKIVHISTGYKHGGAAIACKRLVEAQRSIGIDAHIITQEPCTLPIYVHSTTNSLLKNKLNFFRHALEKFVFLFYQKNKAFRFQFSLANTGESLNKIKLINDADIIHFHWFNAGFISIKKFSEILQKGKPIVWTLHDMWAFTGGCHYAGECKNYTKNCGNCFYLKNPAKEDLSAKNLLVKHKTYSGKNLHFITPSNWLNKCAQISSVLSKFPINTIPNAVSKPGFTNQKDKIKIELGLKTNKKLILFGAFNMEHVRKGSNYLADALKGLTDKDNVELMVFGKKSEYFSTLKYKIHFMGYSSDELFIRKIYSCADVFVNPSIEDNLPNTVLESLSVGTPVVAFDMGGMPDMIDHKKNGFLAAFKNTKELSEGIKWCLENNIDEKLSLNALQKVKSNYSYQVIAERFKKFYSEILNK